MTKRSRSATTGLWITALMMIAGSVVGCDDDDDDDGDFADPNLLHVGTIEGSTMSGTVAARLDLSGTAFGEVDTANVVGTWEAVRE